MGRVRKEQLRALTSEERRRLMGIAAASSERVDRVQRATAVLAVADGERLLVAARQAGFASATTVANLAQRFNQRGLAALGI
ncbi:MAG: helix-turn-helix domain-containing protein, partial [Dehalococcoidia bacterium]